MAKALITGASGFIGGHLVESLLDRGDDVRCLVRETSKLEHLPTDRVELVYGDLRDEAAIQQAVAGVEVVYHLAAMTSAHSLDELMEANAGGSERVAAACAAQPTSPVLIAMSSIAASGPIERGRLRTENDPPAPVSNYGRSKLAGELACRRYADRVPTTLVRAGIVFGPRDRELLMLYRTIRSLRFHPVPTFNPPPLSYIHVKDLVRLLMRCAEDAPRLPAAEAVEEALGQGVFYAVMDEHPDYAEFGKILRKLLDCPHAPMIYLPAGMAYPVAAVNQWINRVRGKRDTLTIDKIREATASSWACSGEAACRELHVCLKSSLEEKLGQTLQWYQEAGWL